MRIAEFDRDEVLRNAMEAFRAKGYAKTTMQELVAATGLHPGSIYGAFGNKRGLLLAAVDHYVEGKRTQRRELLDHPSPLAGLQAYLERVVTEALCGTCLVTRTMMELSEQDEELHQRLKGIYAELEQGLAAQLTLAQTAGELAPDRDIRTLTALLLINLQGLVTFAQCRPDRPLLDDVVIQLMRALRA
ncbi:TetR family transcriptional regulator [Aeromonas veronii]|uniref:TetR/AcrR family transcriptional regulator n=1 Tax=Aeromonas veronii TaxID=654 RepID=UPI0021D9AFE0|nr:TetR/AcrR family transcriptional regulator [Aeromonas veronii]UYB71782.1 TetR family transcriptional regulator [Aeromonas veronii]